eukprot:2055986-Rhodomonas_salina.1
MLGTEGPGYTRMGEVVVDIFRKEGAAGFMRGVWARGQPLCMCCDVSGTDLGSAAARLVP